MSRHVVLGTGQIETPVARQLIDSGNEVAVVSRTGRSALLSVQPATHPLSLERP